jgi:hypothetical protein
VFGGLLGALRFPVRDSSVRGPRRSPAPLLFVAIAIVMIMTAGSTGIARGVTDSGDVLANWRRAPAAGDLMVTPTGAGSSCSPRPDH